MYVLIVFTLTSITDCKQMFLCYIRRKRSWLRHDCSVVHWFCVPCLDVSLGQSLTFELPRGDPTNDFALPLKVVARDQFGSSVTVMLTVRVEGPAIPSESRDTMFEASFVKLWFGNVCGFLVL